MAGRIAIQMLVFAIAAIASSAAQAQWLPLRFDIQSPTDESIVSDSLDLQAWGYANTGWEVKAEVRRGGLLLATAQSDGPLPEEPSSGGGGGSWWLNLVPPSTGWTGEDLSVANIELRLLYKMPSQTEWSSGDSVTFEANESY